MANEIGPVSKSELAQRLNSLKRSNSNLRSKLTDAPAKLSLMHGGVSILGAGGGAIVDAYVPQLFSGAKSSTVIAIGAATLGWIWDMPEGVVFGAGMIGPAVRAKADEMVAGMQAKTG